MFDINLDPFETIGEAIGAARDMLARRDERLTIEQECDEDLLQAIIDELAEDFMEDVETATAERISDRIFNTLNGFEAGLMQRPSSSFYDVEMENAYVDLCSALVSFTDLLVDSHPIPYDDCHTMFYMDSDGVYNYDYYAENPGEREETEEMFYQCRDELVLKYNNLLSLAHQIYMRWED